MADRDSKTNLIVNYLPQTLSEKELYSMFVTIGPLKNCRVMKDYKTGYSYGFGFVEYQAPDDAKRAIQTLNGLNVMNKSIKVSYARPPGENIKDTNLYITGLPRNLSQEQLEELFSPFGNIVQSNLLKDKNTGLPRGVAFVRYDLKSEARAAMQNMNGHIPDEGMEPLTVKIAEEHGKQKAAFYAGWHAGMNQLRQGRNNSRNTNNSRGGWIGYSGGVGRGIGSNNFGAVKAEKPNNRYNPIGFGGGYNVYNWS